MRIGKHYRIWVLVAALLFVLTASTTLAGAREEVIADIWAVMKMAGDESGWTHEKTVKLEADGVVQYRVESLGLENGLDLRSEQKKTRPVVVVKWLLA